MRVALPAASMAVTLPLAVQLAAISAGTLLFDFQKETQLTFLSFS